jgi:hypothetical protein
LSAYKAFLTVAGAGSVNADAAELVCRVLGVAAEMDEGLAVLQREARTTLRVAASLTVSEYLLPGWLVALRGGPSDARSRLLRSTWSSPTAQPWSAMS